MDRGPGVARPDSGVRVSAAVSVVEGPRTRHQCAPEVFEDTESLELLWRRRVPRHVLAPSLPGRAETDDQGFRRLAS